MHPAARATILGSALAAAVATPQRPQAPPEGVRVRHSEGTVHGFLALSTAQGESLAPGDLLQVFKGDGLESRMVFYFADSSAFEETVAFTQHEYFRVQRYHLVQRGPAFAQDMDAMLDRTSPTSGTYSVKTVSHDSRRTDVYTGTVDMPADLYNGLVIIAAKNVPVSSSAIVHIAAFLPKPRIIRLGIEPAGEQRVTVGTHGETSVNYALRPKLNFVMRTVARIAGRNPPDSHTWIVTDDVPAFVRYEGPLYDGPNWRIDLTSPRMPH